MSDITCDRYIAEEGGKGLAAVKKIQDGIGAAYKRRREVRDKYGATVSFENSHCIKGLIFDPVPDKLPPGFVKMSNRDISEPKYWDKAFKPSGRTAEGKALLKEFEIPIPNAMQFHMELTRDYKDGRELMSIQTGPYGRGGMPVSFCSFETFEVKKKKVIVITVPRKWTEERGRQVAWEPSADHKMTLIDQSQYWKWKEAAEKKKAAKAASKKKEDHDA